MRRKALLLVLVVLISFMIIMGLRSMSAEPVIGAANLPADLAEKGRHCGS
jgi:hypothetical protein